MTPASLSSEQPLSERDLLAIAAHELNSGLQSLIMRLDLMQRSGTPDTALTAVRSDVDRLTRLVRDYLVYGQLERHALCVDARPVHVPPLLSAIRERAGLEFGEAFRVDIPDGVWCRFDAGHLDQIVWNLVRNAFKHGTPPVVLTVRQHADLVVFGLGDCGGGFAPDLDCVRLHGRFSINGGGGIGLWLASTLIEAYGGKLWLGQAECGGAHVGFSAPSCLPI